MIFGYIDESNNPFILKYLSVSSLRPASQTRLIHHLTVQPPSTTSVVPVTNEDSSDARKRAALAISMGSPRRSRTDMSRPIFSISGSSSAAAVPGVRMKPGQMALAPMMS